MNKKLPALFSAALFSITLLTACSETEKKTTDETSKPTAADSAAISPLDTRDTGRLDTAQPKP